MEVDCVPEAIVSGPMATAWVAPIALAVQPMARLCLVAACVNLVPSDLPMAIESSPTACVPAPIAIAWFAFACASVPTAIALLPRTVKLLPTPMAPLP